MSASSVAQVPSFWAYAKDNAIPAVSNNTFASGKVAEVGLFFLGNSTNPLKGHLEAFGSLIGLTELGEDFEYWYGGEWKNDWADGRQASILGRVALLVANIGSTIILAIGYGLPLIAKAKIAGAMGNHSFLRSMTKDSLNQFKDSLESFCDKSAIVLLASFTFDGVQRLVYSDNAEKRNQAALDIGYFSFSLAGKVLPLYNIVDKGSKVHDALRLANFGFFFASFLYRHYTRKLDNDAKDAQAKMGQDILRLLTIHPTDDVAAIAALRKKMQELECKNNQPTGG